MGVNLSQILGQDFQELSNELASSYDPSKFDPIICLTLLLLLFLGNKLFVKLVTVTG